MNYVVSNRKEDKSNSIEVQKSLMKGQVTFLCVLEVGSGETGLEPREPNNV
jgi:hypothetical protein